MTTNQPKWRFVANLGDAHPLDHGGYFIYEDETGVYEPEAVLLDEPVNGRKLYEVRRFILDRLKVVESDKRVYLVPFRYDDSWTHPVASYNQWFHSSLPRVADNAGLPLQVLRGWFCSADIRELAMAYRAIGSFHGFDNLDSYPEFLTRDEVEKRFGREVQP